MSPEERQLLQGLFDRMRGNSNAPRDRDAEQMIADQVRQQPYSPYLLAQTVIIQDQALQAANDRLQQLERQVQEHQAQGQQGSGSGGFLSGLFGGGSSSPSRSSVPATTTTQQRPTWNQGATGFPPPPPQNVPQQYAPPPQQGGGPWAGGGGGGWGQQQPMGGGGGGFLKGALGTAAGVAGGVLMADGIRSLFSSGHAGGGLGIGAGVPGVGGGSVTNNYYGDSASSGALSDADRTQDSLQDEAMFNQNNNSGPSAADWQQDADQDQDMAQDAEWGDDDFS